MADFDKIRIGYYISHQGKIKWSSFQTNGDRTQSRSRQGQLFEWIIAAVGGINILAGASNYTIRYVGWFVLKKNWQASCQF